MAVKHFSERVAIESMCIQVTSGGTPSRADPSFWDDGVIPWFKTGELKDWYVDDSEEKITIKAIEKSSAKIFPPNTLLMAMYGDGKTITSLGILRTEAATNQACCAMIVDTAKTNFLYLFYALMNHRHELLQLVVAGAQRNLSGGIIRKFKVTWFPLTIQNRIAEILSAYDGLIENNRRRMALLEESARLLYREWFVRLRFPGYEHTPIVGGVPQGWTAGVVNDLVDVRSGFAFKTGTYETDAEFPIVTIKNVQDGEFDSECNSFIAEPPKQMPAHCYLQTSDILLSLTGNIGRSCHVIGDGYLLNQRVAKLVPINDVPSSFCYFMFRSDEMKGQLSAISYGVAQQNLSPVKMGTLPFKIPSKSLLRMFSDFAEPLVQQSVFLKQQNQKLRAARDLLLPRLMSGELAV